MAGSTFEVGLNMTNKEISQGCQPWHAGSPTKHAPLDSFFLEAVVEAGFAAFTGDPAVFVVASLGIESCY